MTVNNARIENARIKNITVGLDDRYRLSAHMSFKSQYRECNYGFVLTNPTDAQHLVKLMNYTGVSDLKDMNGKIVRIVFNGSFFYGFGDPIEDKFVPIFKEGLKELTEAEFEQLLKNT